jgi:hypothetical protein
MGAQPVAGPFDLDDHGVMQEAIQQGRRDDGIAEHLAPFGEAPVGREDHGTLFIAGVDELEEQVCTACGDRQIADLVDDEQRGSCIEPDLLSQPSLPFGLVQRRDQFCQGCPVDTSPGLYCCDPERGSEMAFARARRPRK